MAVLSWGPGLKRVLAFRGNTQHTNNRLYVQSEPGGTAYVTLGVDADSTDTNVDLRLLTKGTGVLRFGTYATGTGAATGYITIKDAAGNARKLATIA